MKKVYDWDVQLSIRIENNNKTVTVVCSVHTNIHQLKIELCKKLNLSIFDTEIDVYGIKNSWKPMSSISTLQQNGITQGHASLRAVIRREKTNLPLQVKVEQNYNKRERKNSEKNDGCGLMLVASCVNDQCINYQQDTVIQIGYGTVPFYSAISSLKCEVCPYRSQFLRPTMMCKGARLSNCVYKIKGKKSDHQGIPTQTETKFLTVKNEKDVLQSIMSQEFDKDFCLIIKHP